ncbi:MAG TPA: autotransporter-associated beta strand repeat-containing protein [Pirellulales bacterium]|nr:autotransporter-associated beta strand repeat-containing protein [Pirellulales bacterium]
MSIIRASLASLAVVLLFSASGYAQGPTPVAYYTLNANLNDTSGSGFDATVNGNPNYASGLFGQQAFQFDGNTNIPISGATTDQLGLVGGSFTVDAWFNLSSVPSNASEAIFGTLEGGTSLGLQMLIRNDASFLGFYGNDSGLGQTAIQPNTWYNIAFEYNAATQTQSVYLNGNLDLTSTAHTPFEGTGETAYIGGSCCGNNPPGGSLIQDVGVYNSALSPLQIQAAAYSQSPTLTWTGAGATSGNANFPGSWDTNGSVNWIDSNNNPTSFSTSDSVVFADTANGAPVTNSNIQIQSGGLIAENITFSNSSVPYALTDADGTSGSGNGSGITTAASVTVSGGGQVTFSGANSYSGTTTITAGTLQLADPNALQNSTATVNVNGGLLFAPLIGTFNLGGLAGTGNVNLVDSDNQPVTVSVGLNNTSTTYTGTLSDLGTGNLSVGGGLTKVGTGTLTLANPNTYTGLTTINGGSVQLNSANALQNSTATVNVNGGLTFGGGISPSPFNVGGLAGTGSIVLTDTNSQPVNLSVGANGANTTYTGGLGGLGSFTKTGNGTLILGNLNTYTGNTYITGGTLRLAPSAPAGLYQGAVAQGTNNFDLTDPIPQTNIVLSTAGIANNTNSSETFPQGLANSSTIGYSGYINNTSSHNVTYVFTENFDDGAYLSVDGTVVLNDDNWNNPTMAEYTLTPGQHSIQIRFGQGGGGVGPANGGLLNGTAGGTFTPSGTTGYLTAGSYSAPASGTADSDGLGLGYQVLPAGDTTSSTLNITPSFLNGFQTLADSGSGSFLSTGPISTLPTAGSVIMSTNTIFDTNGNSPTIGSLADASGGETGAQVLLGTSGTLTTGTDNTSTIFSGVISGTTGNLIKVGTGTFTLAGANTYGGSTTINGGSLRLNNAIALQNSTATVNVNGGLTFGGGISPSPFNVGGLAGTGSIVLTDSNSQPVNLSVGANGASTTYSGSLTGNGGLTKVGGGTLILAGAGSYGGATVITNGTLRIGGIMPSGVTEAYTFSNASGTTVPNAVSPGTYDGTLINGATVVAMLGAPGGYALSLGAQSGNNDNFLQAGSAGVPTTGGVYTASAWFQGLYGQSSANLWRTLYRGQNNDHQLILNQNSNELGYYDTTLGSGFNDTGFSMGAYNGLSTWNQITVVANGTTSTYYINGQEVGSVNQASTGGIFAIGNYQGGGQAFAQYLSDVNIYSGTALNASQVEQLYQGIGTLPATTPVSIATGAILDLNGTYQTVASLNDYTVGTSYGTVTNSSPAPATLVLAPSSGSATFTGVIQDGNAMVGLTLNGTGTQVLAGANTYTGPTTILNGTLRVNGSLAAGSTVSVGGTGASGIPMLAGSGTIAGPVTVFGSVAGSAAGHLAPSAFTGSSSTTLTLTDGLSLGSGANLDFNLNSTPASGNDLVTITGSSGTVNYAPGGVLNINAYNGALQQYGTYTLINDANGPAPTAASYSSIWKIGTNNDPNAATSAYVVYVDPNTNNLDLTVSPQLTWAGQISGLWTDPPSNNMSNWYSGSTPATFSTQAVAFGDTYNDGLPVSNNNNVTVSGPVSPAAVTFNNSIPYTVDTTGDSSNTGITGSTGMVLNGTGTVTLLGPNTYTGQTLLNPGSTLMISDVGSLGSTIAPLTFNGGTLQYASSPTANTDISTHTVTIAGGGATIDLNGNNVIYANSIGNNGAGALTLKNSATNTAASLTLGGANTYTGGTTINSGNATLISGSSASLGTGPLTFAAAGGTLRLSGSATAAPGLSNAYYLSGTNNIPYPANDGGNPGTNNGWSTFASYAQVQSAFGGLTPSPGTFAGTNNSAGPPLTSYYFGGNDYNQLNNFIGNANGNGLNGGNNFIVLSTGILNVPKSGNYTFGTTSDDGSMMFLDVGGTWQTVVNNNYSQGNTQRIGTINLAAGQYPIEIAYYEGGGGYTLSAAGEYDPDQSTPPTSLPNSNDGNNPNSVLPSPLNLPFSTATNILDLQSPATAGVIPIQIYSNPLVFTASGTIDLGNVPSGVFGPLTIGSSQLSLMASGSSSSARSAAVGSVTLTGNPTFDVASSGGTLYLGALSDGGTPRTITIQDSGMTYLTATATSMVAGTTVNVNGGNLTAGASAALGTSPQVNVSGGNVIAGVSGAFGTLAQVSLSNSGAFSLDSGISQTISSLSNSDGTGIVNLSNSTLTIGSSDNLSSTYAGSFTSAGGATLIQAGTGTLTLTGNSSSGIVSGTQVQVNGGGLITNSAAALGTLAQVTVASGSAWTVGVSNQQVSALSGSGNVALNGVALTVGNNADNVSSLFIGNILDGTPAGGSLRKSGAGTLTINGANNYSGGTMVSNGVLAVGPSATSGSVIPIGTGTVTLNGGTLSLAGGQSVAGPINGFNGTNQYGWLVNSSNISTPAFGAPSVLTLTDPNNNEARSAFYAAPVSVASGGAGFTASFTYQVSGNTTTNPGDGIAFVLQNASGLGALGYNGGNAGYTGIPGRSVAIGVNVDNGGNNILGGTNYVTNGGGGLANINTSPVNIGSGDPINVVISYDGSSTLTETLTDTVTSQTFSQTYTGQNLQSILGSSTAYLGFTGGTGGNNALQTVTNFDYSLGAVTPGTAVYTNNVAVTGTSTISVAGPMATSMGDLTINGSTLNVVGNYNSTDAYSLSLVGAAQTTTLTGNPTFNVSNSVGGGPGTLYLGALNDGNNPSNQLSGTPLTLNFTGTGATTLNYPAVSLVQGTQVSISGTLNSNAAGTASSPGSLGSFAQVNIATGGTLSVGANQTISSLVGSGTVNLNNNTLTIGNTDNITPTTFGGIASFSGTIRDGGISSQGSLIKAGTGTLYLTGASTYNGGTTVTNGVLAVGASTSLGVGTVTLSGGTLSLQGVKPTPGLTGTFLGPESANPNNANYDSLSQLNTWFGLQTPVVVANTTTGNYPNLNFSNNGYSGQNSTMFGASPANSSLGEAGFGFTAQTNLEARFTGYIYITQAGSYTFSTTSDDGSVLFLDNGNSPFVNNNAFQGATTVTETETLSAGFHAITVGYYQGTGGEGLNVQYSGPDTSNQTVSIPNTVLFTSNAVAVNSLSLGNTVSVTGPSTIDITGTSSDSVGALTLGTTLLTVSGGSTGTNVPYTLTSNETTLAGNPIVNVSNNGTGSGTLILGSLNDNGTPGSLTLVGNGTVTLDAPYTSLVPGTVVNIYNGTLNASVAAALGTTTTLNVNAGTTFNMNASGASQTLSALGGSGTVNIGANTLTVGSSDSLSSTFSGTLRDGGAGGILNIGTNGFAGKFTLAGSGNFSGPTTVNSGTFVLATSGSLSNPTIAVNSGSTFAPQLIGGSTRTLGNATTNAILTVNSGTLDLSAGNNIGAFALNQQSSFTGDGLALDNATLKFNVNSTGADELLVSGALANAAVAGTNIIDVAGLGSGLTSGAQYTLLSSPNGGLGGTFEFSNNATTEVITIGGTGYRLSLGNSPTAETLGIGLSVSSVWQQTNPGTYSWSSPTSQWSGENVPQVPGDSATFGSALTSTTNDETITVDQSVLSVGLLTFDNPASGTYTIAPSPTAPGNTLALSNGGSSFTATLTNATNNNTISAPVSLVSNVIADVATGTQLTLSGPLSGTGALNLNPDSPNAGTLVLSGSNSAYSGPISLTAGQLTFSNGSLGNGSSTNTITFAGPAATLQYASGNTQDVSLQIQPLSYTATIDTNGNNVSFASGLSASANGLSNMAGLTKVGSGTLNLAGTNTYQGTTTISGGSLQVSGSVAGTVNVNSNGALGGSGSVAGLVTVASGGIVAPGAGQAPGGVTANFNGGLTLQSGSALTFNLSSTPDGNGDTPPQFSNPYNDHILTSSLGIDGTITFNINDYNTLLQPGTYDLINYTTLSGTAAWNPGSVPTGYNYEVVTTGSPGQVDLIVSTIVNNGSSSWVGTLGGIYGASNSWYQGEIPDVAGQSASFVNINNTNLSQSVTIDNTYTVGSLNFTSGTNFTLVSGGTGSGYSLTLNNNGADGGAQVNLTNSFVELRTSLILGDSSGNTTFSVDPDSYLLTASYSGNSTVISGTGSITLTGGGQIDFEAPNTYTGSTTVEGGTTLYVGQTSSGATLGGTTGSPGALTINDTSIVNLYNNSFNIGNLSGTGGTLYVDSTASLTVNQSNSTGFAGSLQLNGPSLTFNGNSNTLTLSGATTVASGSALAVNSGTLRVSGTLSWGGSNTLSVNGGTLALNPSSAATLSGAVSVTVAAGATLQLAGAQALSQSGIAANITTEGTGNSNDGAVSVVGTTSQTVGVISSTPVSTSPTTYAGNTSVGDGINAASLSASQILQNSLAINAGSTVTILPFAGGQGNAQPAATASSASPAVATASASTTDTSDPFTAIQTAIASGAITSAAGQSLENRITAIENLAATDPGLNASLLESRVLAVLPSGTAVSSPDASPAEIGSSLLASDTSVYSTPSASALGSVTAAFAPSATFAGSPAAVPEPSTLLLAAMAGLGVIFAVRRRKICRA